MLSTTGHTHSLSSRPQKNAVVSLLRLTGQERANNVTVDADTGGGTAKRGIPPPLARTRPPPLLAWHRVCSAKLLQTFLAAHLVRGVGRGRYMVCMCREIGSVSSKYVWKTSSPTCLNHPHPSGGSQHAMMRILSSL